MLHYLWCKWCLFTWLPIIIPFFQIRFHIVTTNSKLLKFTSNQTVNFFDQSKSNFNLLRWWVLVSAEEYNSTNNDQDSWNGNNNTNNSALKYKCYAWKKIAIIWNHWKSNQSLSKHFLTKMWKSKITVFSPVPRLASAKNGVTICPLGGVLGLFFYFDLPVPRLPASTLAQHTGSSLSSILTVSVFSPWWLAPEQMNYKIILRWT